MHKPDSHLNGGLTDMTKLLRIGFHICIMLAVGTFAACSDDDPVVPPVPTPDPNPAGSIGVYADYAGTVSNIVNTGNIVSVYVVHKVEVGTTASAFMVDAPDGWTLVGTIAQFPVVIGNPDTGIDIAYGECMTGSIHLLTLNYQSPGGGTTGNFEIVAPSRRTSIQVVDCNSTMLVSGVGLVSDVLTQ